MVPGFPCQERCHTPFPSNEVKPAFIMNFHVFNRRIDRPPFRRNDRRDCRVVRSRPSIEGLEGRQYDVTQRVPDAVGGAD
jgi:hypothetical protein